MHNYILVYSQRDQAVIYQSLSIMLQDGHFQTFFASSIQNMQFMGILLRDTSFLQYYVVVTTIVIG